jgi:hypothetical protein
MIIRRIFQQRAINFVWLQTGSAKIKSAGYGLGRDSTGDIFMCTT